MNLLRKVSPPNTYKLSSTRAAAVEALPAGGFNACTVNHVASVAETEQSSPKRINKHHQVKVSVIYVNRLSNVFASNEVLISL